MRRNIGNLSFLVACQLLVSFAFAQVRPIIQSDSVLWMQNTSKTYELTLANGLKTYFLKTDAPLRDNFPLDKEIKIDENFSYPYLRTKSSLFDSLFALAMLEVQAASVSTVSDHAFEQAKCDCFETGEKWGYVWTRDTAYATELGLASVDPVRSMNSLLFKVSSFRNNMGPDEQIVQDTGSGGSWPVSTDRIIWSIGAMQTLKNLPFQSQVYNSFLHRAYKAIKNTVLVDRFAIYDVEDGLYTGEQSFLDWREQSYPEWTANKLVHIGMSKSLSTNVAHYMALVDLSELAVEANDFQYALTFKGWADDLKAAIQQHFWDGTSYRSLKTTFLDQRAFKYYDLLGTSLAVISGIATNEQGASALNNYPQTEVGPPVIWPQRQDIPIYHNRAIWPFVTAYALKAATKIRDPYLISSYVRSLIIGPAQNLSHMENYEFTTMRNYFADGKLSGPVVNSRRQLWSVAAYAGMVLDVIYGKETKLNGLRFSPTLTLAIKKELFANSKTLELHNLNFQGKKLKVVLELPELDEKTPDNADALFTVASVMLNGMQMAQDSWINLQDLISNNLNEVRITLGMPQTFPRSKLIRVSLKDPRQPSTKEKQYFYAPKTPALASIGLSDNAPLLSFYSGDHAQITYHVFKNGRALAKTNETYFLDSGHSLDQTACYSITAVYPSGNESFPSEPLCYWPTSSIQHYPINGPNVRFTGGGQLASTNGRVFLYEWGLPHQKLQLEKVRPSQSGTFAIQAEYINSERINTGITCAVKKVSVINDQTGEVVKNSVVMFPHNDGSLTDSSFVEVQLKQKNSYTIVIEDFFNMSYFQHFKTYRHRGGQSGIYNLLNFIEVKLLYLGPSN